MLMQCIDSLVQKVQSGVVINFEKIGPDPTPINTESKYYRVYLHCITRILYAIIVNLQYCSIVFQIEL